MELRSERSSEANLSNSRTRIPSPNIKFLSGPGLFDIGWGGGGRVNSILGGNGLHRFIKGAAQKSCRSTPPCVNAGADADACWTDGNEETHNRRHA